MIARYTRARQSPYPITFNPQALYCGHDLLDDLRMIIADYKPDFVLLPHPNDEHRDHYSASNFTRMALALVSEADPTYQPAIWGYLIHYGFYPQPRGLRPNNTLLPPIPLSGAGNEWTRLDLTPAQIQTKTTALQAYTTQLHLMRSFLYSFARQDEIFADSALFDIPFVSLIDFPVNESGLSESPILPEPADERARQRIMGSADLVGLQVTRLDNLLWLTAETRQPLFPGLRYRLLVKLPNGETRSATWPGSAIRTGRSTFTFQLDLAEIGDPEVLGFAAEVRQGATLDRTSWHFVTLQDGLR